MPRRARMYLPEYPYHIVQRGNNRNACFVEPENYLFYLDLWQECSKRYGVAIHSYCLMTNHVHFLVTPEHEDSISFATKVIGSRYAQYFNKMHKRTGTLWEGRHKSSLVQSERYFLTCARYIELNPVVANMVKQPEQYEWSSYMCNAWGNKGIVKPHQVYLNLGYNREDRQYAYRNLFAQPVDVQAVHVIEQAAQCNRPVGDSRFCEQITAQYGAVFPREVRGRPKKKDEVVNK